MDQTVGCFTWKHVYVIAIDWVTSRSAKLMYQYVGSMYSQALVSPEQGASESAVIVITEKVIAGSGGPELFLAMMVERTS